MVEDLFRKAIFGLFPDVLSEDDEYADLIELLVEIMRWMYDDIRDFSKLADIYACPDDFVEHLGYLIGYKRNVKVKVSVQTQRMMIARLISFYRRRGSTESIVFAARTGSNEVQILQEGQSLVTQKAEVFFPELYLARYSMTPLSTIYRHPDERYWREGVIDVILHEFVSESLKDAVRAVTPAGIRVFFTLDGVKDEIVLDLIANENVISHYNISINAKFISRTYGLVLSNKGKGRLSANRCYSGRQTIFSLISEQKGVMLIKSGVLSYGERTVLSDIEIGLYDREVLYVGRVPYASPLYSVEDLQNYNYWFELIYGEDIYTEMEGPGENGIFTKMSYQKDAEVLINPPYEARGTGKGKGQGEILDLKYSFLRGDGQTVMIGGVDDLNMGYVIRGEGRIRFRGSYFEIE